MSGESFTIREASQELGVSQVRVRELIKKGKIDGTKVEEDGVPRWTIDAGSVRAYLEQRPERSENGTAPAAAEPSEPKAQAPAREDLGTLLQDLERQLARAKSLADEIGKAEATLKRLRRVEQSLRGAPGGAAPDARPTAGQPNAGRAKPDQPKSEQPKADQPKADQPKADQPKAEQPKSEQPKDEQPKAEQPRAEQPKPERAEGEQPNAEQPKAEQPAAQASRAGQPKSAPAKTGAKPPRTKSAPPKKSADASSTDLGRALADAGVTGDAKRASKSKKK